MPEKIISALVEGGKATTGPPIGPALGPMGINAGKVVAEINAKTKEFVGITVPVKIIIDTTKKSYVVEVGAPSTAALIKKETLLEKGSGKAKDEKVADITVDQLIKIMRVKNEKLTARDNRKGLKEIIGTCLTMGVLVDAKDPRVVQKEVDSGLFDDKLSGKTPLKEPSREELEEKKANFAKIIEEKRKAQEAAEAAAKAAAEAAAAPAEGEKAKAAPAAEGKAEAGKAAAEAAAGKAEAGKTAEAKPEKGKEKEKK